VKRTHSEAICLPYWAILLLVAFIFVLNIAGCSNKGESENSEKKSSESAAEILKPDDLEVSDLHYQWSEDKLFCYVSGKINNKTNKQVSSARVTVEFYNSQNQKLAEINQEISNIAPRGKGAGGYSGAKEFKLTTQPGIDPDKLDHVKLVINYVFTY
jgi:hypothetical protein